MKTYLAFARAQSDERKHKRHRKLYDTAQNIGSFEKCFLDRAGLADELSRSVYVLDATVIATTAVDALGEIWVRDFPLGVTPAKDLDPGE